MIIENPDALKSFLTLELRKSTDAEPQAVANYIIAMLKKRHRSMDKLREFCLDQLDVFLNSETKAFVDLLFETLETKSYLKCLPDSNSSGDGHLNAPTSGKKCEANSESLGKSKQPVSSSIKFQQSGKEHESEKKDSSEEKSKEDTEKSVHKRSVVPIFGEDSLLPSKKIKTDLCFEKHSRKKNTPLQYSVPDVNSSPAESKNSSNNSLEDMSDAKSPMAETANVCVKEEVPHDSSHDTDYRQISVKKGLKSSLPLQSTQNSCNNNGSKKRCKDYDEKGYCMRGDLCVFDHGLDPILIEGARAFVFDDFEDSLANSKSPIHSLLAPPLPTSPPPLPPPPPPMLAPGSFVPEPYNPEAPGMINLPPNHTQNLSFYHPSPVHRIPSHPTRPTGTSIQTSTSNAHLFSFSTNFHSKPQRARELIGVPTVGDIDSQDKKSIMSLEKSDGNLKESFKESSDQKTVTKSEHVYVPKTRFDFNRLGPTPNKRYKDGRSLLIRNIPKRYNKIAMLNSHFSKFGRIVNFQVAYNGDPELAVVEYMTNAEANNAYRSTEAVFNNRFIKLFWHKDDKGTSKESVAPNSFFSSILDNKNSEGKHLDSELERDVSNNDAKVNEKAPVPNVYSNTGSRTVFFPPKSVLKKNNVPIHTRRFIEEGDGAQVFSYRLQLIRKKQEFLNSQLTHQKIIMDKLQECKQNEKEREFLKETMETVTANIFSIQNDVKRETEDLKCMLKNASTPKVTLNKNEAEKALLDAEMDLYKRKKTGNETAELLSKVMELKERAKALGLIDSCPPPHVGWKKCHSNSVSKTHLSVDHRPRKFLVTGSADFSLELLSREALTKHFLQFGDVEKVEQAEVPPNSYIITFYSRVEAETAYARASKYGDNVLSFSWIHDTKTLVKQIPDEENDASEIKIADSQMYEDDEEDEDEEDEEASEARSWRR